jgi:hypothetical protein
MATVQQNEYSFQQDIKFKQYIMCPSGCLPVIYTKSLFRPALSSILVSYMELMA